jgi:hypothetical protein
VGRQVDRYVVDLDREVGAVIEIETAEEPLVRFARAAVLRDDHAGNRFEDFAGP